MASTPGRSLLSASVASASSLIALQLLSRLTTFALNQALFRLASPTAFGAASIQLDLVLSTILFLSREGVRGALLRAAGDAGAGAGVDAAADVVAGVSGGAAHTPSARTRTANLAFLPVLAGIPLALGTAAIFARMAGGELQAQPHFQTAVALYALAAVAELLSEPLYNVCVALQLAAAAMAELKVGVRVRAEGLGVTAKSLTTLFVLVYDARAGTGGLALVAFALGQLMYSVVVFGTYIAYLGVGYMRPKLPSPSSPLSASGKLSTTAIATYFDPTSLQLSFTLTLQSLVKHFLTEGDKFILSWFSPLRDQGGYAIAVNYGSLVARIVFQPIEETLRVFFSRTLGAGIAKSISTLTSPPNLNPKSLPNPTETLTPEHVTSIIQAATTLISILTTQASLSLILLVFGTAYLPLLLPLLLPPAYLATSAPSVLAAWVWYIPVLALNGALEAFLASVATPQDLNRQSRWMIGFSAIYITAALLLYRAGLGDASLVYANIINLSVRIVYCLRFIIRFFSSLSILKAIPIPVFSWRSVLPSSSLFLASAMSVVLVWVSERRLGALAIAAQHGRGALLHPRVITHVGVGGILALGCLAVWWRTSGRYLGAIPLRRSKAE